MEKSKIDMWLSANSKYFDAAAIPMIRQKMEVASDESFASLQAVELKDPTVLLIVSLLIGTLGVDRFMLGDVGMGVLKLLTAGCCGILTIVDWFTVMKRARQKNLAAISMVI